MRPFRPRARLTRKRALLLCLVFTCLKLLVVAGIVGYAVIYSTGQVSLKSMLHVQALTSATNLAANLASGAVSSGRRMFRFVHAAEKPLLPYYDCGAEYYVNFSNPELQDALQSKRRFLTLGLEREQLTKGRLHLAEAITLAKLQNRTFILPRVSNSRIGFDRDMALCTYFDVKKIGQSIDWVTEEFFFSEIKRLDLHPLVFSLLLHKPRNRCDRNLWKLAEPRNGSESHPFAASLLSSFSPSSLHVLPSARVACVRERPSRATEEAQKELLEVVEERLGAPVKEEEQAEGGALTGRGLREAEAAAAGGGGAGGDSGGAAGGGGGGGSVKRQEGAGRSADNKGSMEEEGGSQKPQPDVLVVYKIGDEMYFKGDVAGPAQAHIHFAPHLRSAAQSFALRALGGGRFLAIQWRTEYTMLKQGMNTNQMAACTRGLIAHAEKKRKALGLTGVFLASDMSPAGVPSSSSFFSLPLTHQTMAIHAIKKVNEALQPMTWQQFDPAFSNLDGGVQGILDKLVCMEAALFIFPPSECGGKSSSFTRDIIQVRRINRRAYPYEEWRAIAEGGS